jgi:hypothetical protein
MKIENIQYFPESNLFHVFTKPGLFSRGESFSVIRVIRKITPTIEMKSLTYQYFYYRETGDEVPSKLQDILTWMVQNKITEFEER